jgi:hypothetical protein
VCITKIEATDNAQTIKTESATHTEKHRHKEKHRLKTSKPAQTVFFDPQGQSPIFLS